MSLLDPARLVEGLSPQDAQSIMRCGRKGMRCVFYVWLSLVFFGMSYLGALVIEPLVNPRTHCTLCPTTIGTAVLIIILMATVGACVASCIRILLVIHVKAGEADEFESDAYTEHTL